MEIDPAIKAKLATAVYVVSGGLLGSGTTHYFNNGNGSPPAQIDKVFIDQLKNLGEAAQDFRKEVRREIKEINKNISEIKRDLAVLRDRSSRDNERYK